MYIYIYAYSYILAHRGGGRGPLGRRLVAKIPAAVGRAVERRRPGGVGALGASTDIWPHMVLDCLVRLAAKHALVPEWRYCC